VDSLVANFGALVRASEAARAPGKRAGGLELILLIHGSTT